MTSRQSAVLRYLREYRQETGQSPSLREIGAWFGISAEGARKHLDALERKGQIVRARGTHRSIVLVDK